MISNYNLKMKIKILIKHLLDNQNIKKHNRFNSELIERLKY